MSFKDLFLDSEKDKDKNINILSDNVAFHGSTFSIWDFENSTGNIYLIHLSGIIYQINPYEYIINALRRRKNRLPNGTKEEALE